MMFALASILFLMSCACWTFLAVTHYKSGDIHTAFSSATLSMMTAACAIYHAIKAFEVAL